MVTVTGHFQPAQLNGLDPEMKSHLQLTLVCLFIAIEPGSFMSLRSSNHDDEFDRKGGDIPL